MPRLTNATYLKLHHQLRNHWLTGRQTFSRLTPRNQWLLHDYFQPSKHLTEAELLIHRQQVTKLHPSLPQQAGRALRRLRNGLSAQAAVTASSGSKRGSKTVHVRSLARPEIKVGNVAKVLLDTARKMDK